MTGWHIEGEWFKNCNCDPCPSRGGPIEFDLRDSHSSMAFVQHGSDLDTGAHNPTVVDKAF